MRCLPLLALLLSSLAGCSSSEAPPADLGDLGRMQFTFDGFGCFEGCSPRQPIAKGASVVLAAKGDDPAAGYHGRVSGSGIVVEQEGLLCTCEESSGNGSSRWSLPPDEVCYAPAVKHCSRAFTLRGTEVGPSVLEVLGPDDAVIDRIGVVVASVARLEVVLQASRPSGGVVHTIVPSADGAFEVDAPARVELGTQALDAQGNELRKQDGAVRFASAEVEIVGWEGRYGTRVDGPGVVHATAEGFGVVVPFVMRAVGP